MRKTAYILLGIAITFTALTLIVYGPSLTSAQSDVYLPIIGANGVQSADNIQSADIPCPPLPDYEVHPEDKHYLDNWCDLPRSDAPYDGAPIIRPAPGKSPLTDEEMHAMAEYLQRRETSAPRIIMSGLDTAGSTITIAGKAIKLPDEVYVDAYVVSMSVDPGQEIPKTPIHVLRKLGEDRQWATIIIDREGVVTTYHELAEVDALRQDYAPVLSALGVDLIVKDPETDEVIQ